MGTGTDFDMGEKLFFFDLNCPYLLRPSCPSVLVKSNILGKKCNFFYAIYMFMVYTAMCTIHASMLIGKK